MCRAVFGRPRVILLVTGLTALVTGAAFYWSTPSTRERAHTQNAAVPVSVTIAARRDAPISVEPRQIEVGPSTDDLTIVNTGLTEGDRVVTDGQYKLQPKTVVTLRTDNSGPGTAVSSP